MSAASIMRRLSYVSGSLLLIGVAEGARAQHATPSAALDTTRLVTTSFTDPTRPENAAFNRSLGACISIFDRTLSVYQYDHPPDLTPAHDTLMRNERDWFAYPPEAIEVARRCYHAVYPTAEAVPDADVPTLWPLAVAMNEDSLAQVLVTRWLGIVGPDTGARAQLLEDVVRKLVLNGGPNGSYGTHLTNAHVAQARQYIATLRAMGSSQVLTWLRARDDFQNAGGWRLDSDANIQSALDDAQQALAAMRAVPPSVLSAADRSRLRENMSTTAIYGIQRLTYLKSLGRGDLRRFVRSVDSTYPGGKRPWLVGAEAPPLTADYWFGTPTKTPTTTPSSAAPPTMPVPNAVSLIVFLDPVSGRPATGKDAVLRRLHAKYPALQIILMTVTTGVWANQSLLGHPEREAQLMYSYVHDSLQVPGIMGVLRGQQRAVTSDGKMFPVQLPLLDRYLVDVGSLNGQVFLVDRDGLVVDQGMSLVPLVPRLLAKSARSSRQP